MRREGSGLVAAVRISSVRFRTMLENRNRDISDACAALQTSCDLRVLEETDVEISFEDLELLAKYFKRPWSYLLVDAAEPAINLGQDHRTFFNRLVRASADLIDELDAAIDTLSVAAELFPEEGFTVPPLDMSAEMPPSQLGRTVRDFLGVSVDDQIAARDDYAALRLWIDALEATGVYVSQRRLKDPTVRAFSKIEDDQALIVVDTGDTPYARIFSLLHEYGHVLLRSTGICDLDQHDAIERYCNEVAASTLVPLWLVKREVSTWRFGVDATSDDLLLQELSTRLRVSQAALLIRLEEAGVITEEQYDAMEGRRQTRKVKPARSGGDFYRVAINKAGRHFARNVFEVLDDGVIDKTEAAVYLEVGEHLLQRFRGELSKQQGESE